MTIDFYEKTIKESRLLRIPKDWAKPPQVPWLLQGMDRAIGEQMPSIIAADDPTTTEEYSALGLLASFPTSQPRSSRCLIVIF
ncbi:Uncharacterized protein TCM_031716 [Theobroma cacao]|uniref:Uncharacterized protein n=1 Tax=Theobroma cacao TaxID=3641 RepID=A0A061F8K4_THECC|nr:Uncharacterized protein TCM_031716 [Theobroma cacao]